MYQIKRSNHSVLLSLMNARGVLVVVAMLALAGCERDSTEPTAPPTDVELSTIPIGTGDLLATTLGGPIAGLTEEELARFEAGREDFQEIETIEDGLGPVFNEAGCVSCHDEPVGGTNGRLETRFGKWEDGRFDPLEGYGGSLMQDQGIGKVRVRRDGEWRYFTFVAEVVPRRANQSSLRNTTALFGLGFGGHAAVSTW
jgi:hypothetical protein